MRAIAAGILFDGASLRRDHAVLIETGRVVAVCPVAELTPEIAREHLPPGWTLSPGLVDLQVNGGGGVLLNDAPDQAGIAAIAAAHRALGTTALLPTLISGGAETVAGLIGALAGAMESIPGILGLHLEGPHLAPARRGIHPAASIRPLLPADLEILCAPHPGRRVLTLAPETLPDGALATLARAGNIVFAGHTEAGWAQIAAARAGGLRGVTHLFNAMRQIGPREPGTVGAALCIEGLYAGLILDGLHVHPANAALALRLLGPQRLFLVSDAMPTVGGAGAAFRIGATEVRLDGGRLAAANGTLGGAHLCLAEAVRNAMTLLGATLADALRMATSTPAAAIGADDVGRLGAGARADLIALDAAASPRAVWSGGALYSGSVSSA
jgi:N-acetylglucosamine-6-phosphate deacetylase